MAIEFCPLTADWGNWADWAAVVIGMGAAAGTIAVATVANQTSKQAAEIARQATLIAKQQLDVTVATDKANARIVGQLILHEVSDLPCRIFVQYQRATRRRAYDSEGELIGADVPTLFEAVQDCSTLFLPVTQKVQDRIHLLPEKLGEQLAMVIGLGITLNAISSNMLTIFEVRVTDTRYGTRSIQYKGNEHDFDIFRTFLMKLSDESIALAEAFGAYVGIAGHDFQRWAVASKQ